MYFIASTFTDIQKTDFFLLLCYLTHIHMTISIFHTSERVCGAPMWTGTVMTQTQVRADVTAVVAGSVCNRDVSVDEVLK